MRNLFDYLKSISANKTDLSNEAEFETAYNPFMISRYISMHPSTALYAHFINKGNLDKKSHYLFLLHSLPQEKIFFKYQKKEKLTDVKFIRDCFDISEQKAKEYSKMLTKPQLKIIKKKYGGKVRK